MDIEAKRAKLLEEIEELEDEIDVEEEMREEEGIDSMNLDLAYDRLDELYAKLEALNGNRGN